MTGTIRSRRFFDMVTSKNVSWRVRRDDSRRAGIAIAVSTSAMLGKKRTDAGSRCMNLRCCLVKKEWSEGKLK
jgi:hypothetical protein